MHTLRSIKTHWWLLLTAIIAITFFSQSSFFYPFNEWCDANCYFDIGRGALKGLVPYRDLYDQKGPLLYLIQAVGALMSNTSHIGVYFLEIASLFVFLYLSWRLLKDVFQSRYALPISILTGILVCSSLAFAPGNCAEEFSLPFLMLGVYLGAKQTKRGTPFTKKELYLLGLCVGFILWTKFTILGLYVGFFLFYLYRFLREKRYAELGQMVLFVGAGLLSVTLVVLLYFLSVGAVGELFHGYFYQCIFGYRKVTDLPWYKNLAEMLFNVFSTFWRNYCIWLGLGFVPYLLQKYWNRPSLLFFIAGGAVALLPFGLQDYPLIEKVFIAFILFAQVFVGGLFWQSTRTSRLASFFVSVGLGSYFFVFFITRQVQLYYPLVLFVYLPIGMHFFTRWAERKKGGLLLFGLFAAGVLAITIARNRNLRRFLHDKSEYIEYQFAQRIKQHPHATMLTYEVKSNGFYLAAEKLSPCRYGDATVQVLQKEQKQMQDSIVQHGGVDFVVTGRLLHNPHYELVDTGSTSILTDVGEIVEPRYLYQKK